MNSRAGLRVAFLAGTLDRGGAEKQLVHMTAALRAAGAEVRVYTLASGGHYEAALRALGVMPVHVGRRSSPVLRLLAFAAALGKFRPHVVQAGHFYANLYVALAAPPLAAIGVGAIRGDLGAAAAANGRWTRPLLRMPTALIANSEAARSAALARGVPAHALHVVPNVIAIGPPPVHAAPGEPRSERRVTAVVIANLWPVKRVDRFLEALALARRKRPELVGVVLGDGPERAELEARARVLGLMPGGVEFAGHCADVRGRLLAADMSVMCSDSEGFPNVILEAMEAGLPVITTPAGDAGAVVVDGVTGFVVPHEVEAMAERMDLLCREEALRLRLGGQARARVCENYGADRLTGWLVAAYRAAGSSAGAARVVEALPG